jgi:LmbE family N-acetylglucosaminyl deacetylase
MTDQLTFVAVHAHPDDEASSTGGTFPLLKSQGVRTVLVTCTNGEHGDSPGGHKPDHDDHDPDVTAEHRRDELDRAVAILNIDRLVRLGYRDSGMKGWPQNDDPRSFWATPVDEAAEKLAVILREERPQVVVTYNAFGFYGHPDHIQAHRITQRAIEMLDYEPSLFYNAIPNSVMAQYQERWRQEAIEEYEAALARGENPESPSPPEDDDGERINLGTPDEEISVTLDVSAVADQKFDALAAHESQIADSFWMKMGRERFREVMRYEWFVRARNPLGLNEPETDLYAGYR